MVVGPSTTSVVDGPSSSPTAVGVLSLRFHGRGTAGPSGADELSQGVARLAVWSG